MTIHRICDKCDKAIDEKLGWVQIQIQVLKTGESGVLQVDGPVTTKDYHKEHVPNTLEYTP